LGLQAYASDLNPVAVILSKAMIEIPTKFAGSSPVGQIPTDEINARLDLPKKWLGTSGLAEDVRRYGAWMLSEAKKRVGHLYPKYRITAEMARDLPSLKPYVGKEFTIIASLWARTVKSPNPAFSHVDVPLASTFVVSDKEGNQTYIQPIVKDDRYHFIIKFGQPPSEAKNGTSAGRRAAFTCLVSGSPIDYNYIRAEGMAGRLGQKLMAVIAEGPKGRIYLPPTAEMEAAALTVEPTWKPHCEMPKKHRNFQPPAYGMSELGDLFTARQLVALTTFSELVLEAQNLVKRDALAAGLSDNEKPLVENGLGATAYSQAVSVYLGCALSRLASYNNTICHWNIRGGSVGGIFSRHAIPMSWDYIEVNPLEKMSGNWVGGIEWVSDVITELLSGPAGSAQQADAGTQLLSRGKIISTDPPYYDNISYADLSDFFYVWLRPSLQSVYPDLFATVAVPKAEELVAAPLRHGSKENAEAFFLVGMTEAMHRLAEQAHPAFPVTIYYAFKQSESDNVGGTASTGWDTFLDALIRSGFAVTGTWPMRTERTGRPTDINTNALASSIVLVCRKRPADTPAISRREFLRELNATLPEALDEMTKGSADGHSPVAPVDLSQSIIGPGMAIFSKYAAVLEADGSPMSVRSALQLINRFLAEDDFDADTQFCLHWFEQYSWTEGAFGDADTLSRGKGTSVDGMKVAGILKSGGGKVRLLKWAEYPGDWDPRKDSRLPVWEALHQLIRALKQGGEYNSGLLLAALVGKAEAVRQLAYRLYTLCERLGLAEDARAYNELITSWTGIESAASAAPTEETQGSLF
jgi:putative DNA methylase